MNAVPSRQQFLRTIDAIDTRQAEYDTAVAARDWEHRNRYDMLAAELGVFGHVFNIPEYGDCLRGDA